MKKLIRFVVGIVIPAFIMAGGVANSAVAQEKALKEYLVGTWTLASIQGTRADGSKYDLFGARPTGIIIFDDSGHFSAQLMDSDLPKFKSNNRGQGTPDENKAIVQGNMAYFGTYSVVETDRTLNFHVMGSSFPNANGANQKRIITAISIDELKWHDPAASVGGTADLEWKRAK